MKNWSGWLVLFLGVLIGLAAGALVYLLARQPSGQPIILVPRPTAEPMMVHVAGAVALPGLYQLPPGSRVQQAVDAAGGLNVEADVGNINLAAFLQDGQKVYIPLKGETIPDTSRSSTEAQSTLVNINTAQIDELMTLPGIGEDRANAIITYREKIGGFKTIDQIQDIEGIGLATFEKLKTLITISPQP